MEVALTANTGILRGVVAREAGALTPTAVAAAPAGADASRDIWHVDNSDYRTHLELLKCACTALMEYRREVCTLASPTSISRCTCTRSNNGN